MALTKRGAARGDKSTCLGNTSNHTEKLTYSLCDVRNCGRCEEMKRPAKNRNYAVNVHYREISTCSNEPEKSSISEKT